MEHIFVGEEGLLALGNGKQCIAIRPAGKKGEKGSAALTSDGEFVMITGQRIAGVGVKRFVTERGFTPATQTDPRAIKLADQIALREGVKLAEEAAQHEAQRLQCLYGGKCCVFVPFAAEEAPKKVLVEEPGPFRTTIIDMASGFSSASVKCVYRPQDGFDKTDAQLAAGWLCAPDEDPAAMPRATKYGGLVEQAGFAIASCGVARLVPGREHLELGCNERFPRGSMELVLADSQDRLAIGIDAVDELVVQYVRGNGEVVFERCGLDTIGRRLNLGSAIGSIAAVLVHVKNMDQAGQTRKKKSA
jgi:hypothetical protein